MGGVDVDEVIDALYELPPARFTAARDEAAARAKKAGDPAAGKRIAGLRRPTLAAWTSNTLVRAKPEEVEQFRQLGQALRAAHRSLDGEQLRDLSHQQHVVIGALAREAQRLADEAGTPVSDTVLREVGQILYAALADPDAAEAWASGRLAKAPALVTEFPDLDPDAAPPAPRPVARPAPAVRRPDRRVEAARAAAQDAEWAATAREDELRVAEEARQRTVEAAVAADTELERAQAARDRAYAAVTEAEERHREAGRTAAAARRAAKAAGRRLRALAGDAAAEPEGGDGSG
ncbi:hypothetical protein ACGFYU_05560 [Streptomyces sp. NPDC048337]|uniref:hypothetical protein n=1 Tax=Streptomyces sp. NPDC048337 TaxID=3365535 RepID=UPI0037100688